MKQILSFVSVIFISVSSIAQKPKPIDPCCAVISINTAPIEPCCTIITVRDKTTGEVHSLKVDKTASFKIGEAISIDMNAKKVIDGGTTSFVAVEPNSFEPCCGIVSIKNDPLEPPDSYSIVTAKLNGSNETFNFSVPNAIASSLHVGDAVARKDNYAFITPANKTTYSYATQTDQTTIGSGTGGAGTGRVHLELPKDDECFIFIYEHGTNKELKGTSKDRSFVMAPGAYDIKVSSVKMQQITVQKGMDTKILAGSLNITSPASWQLFDQSKKIRITGASKPEKIGLPVGNYQLKINGSFSSVTIKDGETVDF